MQIVLPFTSKLVNVLPLLHIEPIRSWLVWMNCCKTTVDSCDLMQHREQFRAGYFQHGLDLFLGFGSNAINFPWEKKKVRVFWRKKITFCVAHTTQQAVPCREWDRWWCGRILKGKPGVWWPYVLWAVHSFYFCHSSWIANSRFLNPVQMFGSSLWIMTGSLQGCCAHGKLMKYEKPEKKCCKGFNNSNTFPLLGA